MPLELFSSQRSGIAFAVKKNGVESPIGSRKWKETWNFNDIKSVLKIVISQLVHNVVGMGISWVLSLKISRTRPPTGTLCFYYNWRQFFFDPSMWINTEISPKQLFSPDNAPCFDFDKNCDSAQSRLAKQKVVPGSITRNPSAFRYEPTCLSCSTRPWVLEFTNPNRSWTAVASHMRNFRDNLLFNLKHAHTTRFRWI